MTRKSYNPSLLDGLKNSRSACTIKQNRKLEPYKHGAMVISRKGKGAVISYGDNNFNAVKCIGSTHAEADALNNALIHLKKRRNVNITNTRRRLAVDVVVLRTTGGNSKPCYHCITEQLVDNRYFNVRKVIYSDLDVNGGYVETNCNKLYETRESHYSGFHSNNNQGRLENECCDGNIGTCHDHDHNQGCCGELDEVENDDDDEELLCFSDFTGIT
jgi:hypothetical protein